MNPAILQFLAKLGIGAGTGLANALSQQGNPQAYAQQQEDQRQQAVLGQQRWFQEQNLARQDAASEQAQKNFEAQRQQNQQQTDFANHFNLLKAGFTPTPSGGTPDLTLGSQGYSIPPLTGADQVTIGPDTLAQLGIKPGGTSTALTVPFEKAQPFFDTLIKARQTHETLSAGKQAFSKYVSENLADEAPSLAKALLGRADSAETPADLREGWNEAAKYVQASQVEKGKDKYAKGIGKLVTEGLIQPGDVADLNKIGSAIGRSKTLQPDEKAFLTSYPAANTTPATSQANTVVRMEGLQESREYQVLDSKTNQLVMMNAKDINDGNRQEKGRYVMGNAQGISTAQRGAQYQALHYSIDKAKNAINNLSELDAGTRLQLANAMSQDDIGTMREVFRGSIASLGNEKQKEAVRSLQLLSEDAMSLRNLQGVGAGSDMVRNAVHDLLPSGKSADKKDMQARIANFEALVNNLETGNPQLGNRPRQNPIPGGQTGGQVGGRPPLNINFTLPKEATQ